MIPVGSLRRFRLAAAVGALSVPLAVSGCIVRIDSDGYRARAEKRFPVSGPPEVKLTTFDGPIVVRGWERDEVFVEIEKRGRDAADVEAIEIEAEQRGDEVSVEARQPGGRTYAFGAVTTLSREAHLVASVPQQSRVMLRTGDGSISIERVTGRIELRTGDGSITGLDLRGEFLAHTDDGAIRVEGMDGRCDATTGDGSITIHGRFDSLRARTGDGPVVVKLLPGSMPTGDWDLATGDGAMVLYVPDGLSADIDADASGKVARVDHGLPFEGGADLPRGVLRGRLGAGGPTIRLRTGDGAINLKRLPGQLPVPSASTDVESDFADKSEAGSPR